MHTSFFFPFCCSKGNGWSASEQASPLWQSYTLAFTWKNARILAYWLSKKEGVRSGSSHIVLVQSRPEVQAEITHGFSMRRWHHLQDLPHSFVVLLIRTNPRPLYRRVKYQPWRGAVWRTELPRVISMSLSRHYLMYLHVGRHCDLHTEREQLYLNDPVITCNVFFLFSSCSSSDVGGWPVSWRHVSRRVPEG